MSESKKTTTKEQEQIKNLQTKIKTLEAQLKEAEAVRAAAVKNEFSLKKDLNAKEKTIEELQKELKVIEDKKEQLLEQTIEAKKNTKHVEFIENRHKVELADKDNIIDRQEKQRQQLIAETGRLTQLFEELYQVTTDYVTLSQINLKNLKNEKQILDKKIEIFNQGENKE